MSLQCIKEVNQDIAAGIKNILDYFKFFSFNGWWERNQDTVVIFAFFVSVFTFFIGGSALGAIISVAIEEPSIITGELAHPYLPFLGSIIGSLVWAYIIAYINKCTDIFDRIREK